MPTQRSGDEDSAIKTLGARAGQRCPSAIDYGKVLADAGIADEDLALLRELAVMNAHEFSHAQETLRLARVFL